MAYDNDNDQQKNIETSQNMHYNTLKRESAIYQPQEERSDLL